jgi:integrase
MQEVKKKSNRQGRGGDGLHRKRKGGSWYFYHGKKPNGKPNELSTGKKDYNEALAYRAAYIKRSQPMRVGKRTKFQEVAQNWKETRDFKSKVTGATYLNALNNHLLPHFESMAVRDINADDLRNYQSKRLGENGDEATINLELSVFRMILNRLELWQGIKEDFEFFPSKGFSGRPWQQNEVDAVSAELASQKSFWYFSFAETILYESGMAHKQCRCLRRRDIDLIRGIFSVSRPTTKSPNGVRIFRMTAKAREAATELLEEAKKRGSTEPEHFVFPGTVWGGGKRVLDPTRPISNFNFAWRKVRQCAGIDPKLRLQDLRSTLATDMSEVGINPLRAGQMLGMSEPVRAGIRNHSLLAKRADMQKVEHMRNERAKEYLLSQVADTSTRDDDLQVDEWL